MDELVRIAILSADDNVCAFLDNGADKALHYYDDILHTYLEGSQYTFEFSTRADHEDSQFLVEGNHLSFTRRNKDYYLTIVNVQKDEETITVMSYGLTLELTNEMVSASSGTSLSFEQYVKQYGFENTFVIGVNEVSDKRISNEWTGEETILARLFSLANVFDAELEFVTELNEDYSLKQITLNVYRKHSDTYQGIGEDKSGTIIRYGQGIEGITKTSDITDLYTSIRPTGTDGLTLTSLGEINEYDEDGNLEYWHEANGRDIRAMQARERFPSLAMGADNDRWIVSMFSYDTDNVNTLYGQALAELKKNSEPKMTYEVDGYIDGEIGDTYTIEDVEFNPVLYLEARIIEQEISFTDTTRNKTKLDNFTELTSEVSTDLLTQMKEMIDANKTYQVIVSSSNGLVLPPDVSTTVLTAFVRDGAQTVTDRFTVNWYKDGTLVYTGTSLSINRSDLDPSVVYSIEAVNANGEVRGMAEVSVVAVEEGVTIQSVVTTYQLSNSGTATPTGEWLPDMPEVPQGQYLWAMTVTTYSDGQTFTQYSVTRNPLDGDPGTSITITSTSIVYQAGTSGTTAPTGQWSEDVPSVGAGQFLWTRTTVIYSDGERTVAYSVARSGVDGQNGQDGQDGRTSYFHIKYSSVSNPTSSEQMTETPSTYIGTYVDFTVEDSTDPSDYTWSRFEGLQGPQGEQGIPGENGESGQTSYLHIAYADSADGSSGFSTTDSTDKLYIGQYVDFEVNDSTDPTKYSWSKIQGPQGPQGEQGGPGPAGQDGEDGQDGANGQTSYFHVKYSSVANPTSSSQMSETPNTYIGTYVDFTEADSNDPNDYTWARFQGLQGEQGEQGIPGTNGENGQTSYLHIAYANSADGSSGFSTTDSTNKTYIGQYVDFTQADSTTPSDYSWTKIQGPQGPQGEQGEPGQPGQDGQDGQDGTSITITSTSVQYAISSNGTTAPSSGWQDTIPATEQGQYLWTRTIVEYSDGKSTTSYSVSRDGVDGMDGEAGFSLVVDSSNGVLFRGQAINTTLTAHVYKGSMELTGSDLTNAGTISWYISGSDTAAHTGSVLTISEGDVESSVTYIVKLEKDGQTLAIYTISLAQITDIQGIYRYYQTGTEEPSVPTSYPPADPWTSTMPEYQLGMTDSLYFVDVTVFSDLTYQYSEVQLSSDFEAVKATYADALDQIRNAETQLWSDIQQSNESIRSDVAENYYQKDQTDALIGTVSTSLEQTKDSFDMKFNSFQADLDNLNDGTTAQFQEIEKYIRFVDGNIILGESGNELVLTIQNDRISFSQNGQEVAYFSNNKLNVTDADVTHSLRIGDFIFSPRPDGSLDFKKAGG